MESALKSDCQETELFRDKLSPELFLSSFPMVMISAILFSFIFSTSLSLLKKPAGSNDSAAPACATENKQPGRLQATNPSSANENNFPPPQSMHLKMLLKHKFLFPIPPEFCLAKCRGWFNPADFQCLWAKIIFYAFYKQHTTPDTKIIPCFCRFRHFVPIRDKKFLHELPGGTWKKKIAIY